MTASPWPFGSLPSGGVEQLGPHVFTYYAGGYPYANSAVVLGTKSALVFDANIFHHASELKSLLQNRWPRGEVRLVLSHSHADHVDGAMYFSPGAQTWSPAWTQGRLTWWTHQDMSERNREYVDGYPAALRWYETFRLVIPEHGITNPLTMDLGGGVRVKLTPEEIAHTPGDLWALVEPDQVVLCGDLWFNDCEPWLGLGALKGSLRVIQRLRAIGARSYLPGHGRAGQIAPGDMMERYISWLGERVVAGMEQGLTGAALGAQVRRDFESQAVQPTGIHFAFNWKGFLEDAVEAVEDATRGRARYADIPIAAVQKP
jgi:cyclase